MMVKTASPNAYDFGEPVTRLIKRSSRGLRGDDRQRLVKAAGEEFAYEFDKLAFAAGEVPILALIVGATEFFGPNRNGDGFKEAACRRFYDTFVKYARYYRDHINRDKAKSYGTIKGAGYHPRMRRIQLAIALNGDQPTAEQNGGLVADKELEKLARDEPIPVSMSCRVSHDVCSHCGHKARTPQEYCEDVEDGGHCKAGGLRRNMGRLCADGTVLHADNPEPCFFDASGVFRPADRIAYALGRLEKTAAAQPQPTGAALAAALGVDIPVLFDRPYVPARAEKQAAELQRLLVIDSPRDYGLLANEITRLAFLPAVQPALPLPGQARTKLGQFLRAAADERILLPVEAWLRLTTNAKEAADAAVLVHAALPGSFHALAERNDLAEQLACNPYLPAPDSLPEFRQWACKAAADWSIAPDHVQRRTRLAALRGASPATYTPAAVRLPAAEKLAEQYVLYKLAFSASVPDSPLTRTFLALQNIAV